MHQVGVELRTEHFNIGRQHFSTGFAKGLAENLTLILVFQNDAPSCHLCQHSLHETFRPTPHEPGARDGLLSDREAVIVLGACRDGGRFDVDGFHGVNFSPVLVESVNDLCLKIGTRLKKSFSACQ